MKKKEASFTISASKQTVFNSRKKRVHFGLERVHTVLCLLLVFFCSSVSLWSALPFVSSHLFPFWLSSTPFSLSLETRFSQFWLLV